VDCTINYRKLINIHTYKEKDKFVFTVWKTTINVKYPVTVNTAFWFILLMLSISRLCGVNDGTADGTGKHLKGSWPNFACFWTFWLGVEIQD
jgi:hypothetical protein